jgi:hypothetical protein
MITIQPDVVQQTATITGLQLNPMYSPTGTLLSIRVIAVGEGNIPVPNWAQPNRRQPTSTEMAAIIATPMLPGEVQIPTWIDRAAMSFMQTVYGDLLNPADALKGPKEVAPSQPQPQPQPTFQAQPQRFLPQRGQRPQLPGQPQPQLPPGFRPPPGVMRRPQPQGDQTMPSTSAQPAPAQLAPTPAIK